MTPGPERYALREVVVGATCALLGLVTLVTIADLYVRRADMCIAAQRCHDLAVVATTVGLIGLILLFHGVATPVRH